MKTSRRGIALIQEFEGYSSVAYRDPIGIWTIGYGFIEGVREGDRITKEQATDRLKRELVKYEQAVVQVAGPLAEDLARLEAVRDALGPSGAIRCDAGGRWDVDTAVAAIGTVDRAAGGVEFVEQPCAALEDVAAVRRRVDIAIAVGASIRDSAEPMRLRLADCADIAVLTVGALGGVRRALRVAETSALPCIVAGELQSSIGIAGGLALAGVLPDVGFAGALGSARLLSGDLVSDARSLIPVDGYLPVAPMPPAPDPERLRQFAPPDAATEARWRALLSAAQAYI